MTKSGDRAYDPVSLPSANTSLLPKFWAVVRLLQPSRKGVLPRHREQLHQRAEQVVSGLRQVGLRAVSLEDPEPWNFTISTIRPPLKRKS